jgi:hypothetical protein
MLMFTHAQHRSAESAMRSGVIAGRLSVLPSGARARQLRTQSVLVRLISITEAFASTQLVGRLERHMPPPRKSLSEALFIQAEDRATSTWENMESNYKKWVSKLELKMCPQHADVKTLVGARNAIVHGLGGLTKRQLRDPKLPQLITDLGRLDITVDRSHQLTVSEAGLRRSTLQLRGLVVWLDKELSKRP